MTDQSAKAFIKLMPVWEHAGQFKASLCSLRHDLDSYIGRTDERLKRAGKLSPLNYTNKQVKLPFNEASDDQDIVKFFEKVHGKYSVRGNEQPKHEPAPTVGEQDPLRDESIRSLEAKVNAGDEVYAMVKAGEPWVKCRVNYVVLKRHGEDSSRINVVTFRLTTLPQDGSSKSRIIDVSKYSVARIQEHGENLKPSKRVIAGLTKASMLPGIIGDYPCEENKHRYLVFMDDGSDSYFKPDQVYPIFGQSATPWLDSFRLRGGHISEHEGRMRFLFSRHPQRCLLKARVNSNVEILRNGMWVPALIVSINCDTASLLYNDGSQESIYLGSPRLVKKWAEESRLLKHQKSLAGWNAKLVTFMYLYYETSRRALNEDIHQCIEGFDQQLILSKHQTARKSTCIRTTSPPRFKVKLDGELVDDERIDVEDLDDDQIEASKAHRCSPLCLEQPDTRTETSVKDMIDEFRNVSDLKVPLLLGWKRRLQEVPNQKTSGSKLLIVYEAPCGKLFHMSWGPLAIKRYLSKTNSKLDIDYFSFEREVDLNDRLGVIHAVHFIKNMAVDSKTNNPLENKHISVINAYNEERLPEDFEYRSESFPHPLLKEKGFDFNPEFKSCCDCKDDCNQRVTCACHQLNEEASGATEKICQYSHKRLLTQVGTGIFECNSMCKCSSKCSNRVVQNGIRFRLQVQKTLRKGWGVITLDDIPKGAFICTYAAEVLDDANQYGNNDMYYADLDYVSVNEKAKEIYYDDSEKSDEGVESDSEDEMPQGKQNGKRKNRPCSSRTERIRSTRYVPRPKFKRIHDLLESHDFTLDARMQGNVGRFFNHSCDPNAFVQNVFIETHDLRFPTVAFFAVRCIQAGDEITWNYNYKMGSIPGRRIDCHCEASNCKGRIL